MARQRTAQARPTSAGQLLPRADDEMLQRGALWASFVRNSPPPGAVFACVVRIHREPREVVMRIADWGGGRCAAIGAVLVGIALAANQAQASFHLFRIAEMYSDAAGIVQFVELHEGFGADFQDQFAG